MANGSGNGHNGIGGILSSNGIVIRNVGLIGGRRGPIPTLGRPNNVIRGRTTVRISGMTVFGTTANGTSHMNFEFRSNGGIHFFGSGDRAVGWFKMMQ